MQKKCIDVKECAWWQDTATSLEPIDSIFTISFRERMTQFDILDLLLLGDIHCICHMAFH